MDAEGTVSPPEHGFMALLEVGSDAPTGTGAIAAAFHGLLSRAGATNIGEVSVYYW